MRVLGVDPGTIVAGWAVVDVRGRQLIRIDAGTIRVGRRGVADRLARVYKALVEIIARFEPDELSLERSFVARNAQSALRLGEARGVAMAAAAAGRLELAEYAPATIKKAVVGSGRAGKSEVQAAVVRMFRLAETPPEDEADALAAAACHGLSRDYLSRVRSTLARAEPRRRGRARRALG